MLKVLHLIQGCGGGVASLIGNLVCSADKAAVQQDVMSFTFENGDVFVEKLKRNGCKTFLLPRPRKEGMRAFRDYAVKIMREEKYDVIHCHSDGWRTILYRELARKAGVPLFCVHAHRASNDPGFLKQNKCLIRLDQMISRKNADVKFACGTDAAKFIYGDVEDYVIIPNGINLRRCQEAAKVDTNELKASLGIAQGQTVIFQVGRLVTQKNHSFTVEIARELKARGVPYTILIAGTGGLEPSIREMLAQHDLSDRVILLGRRNDIYELMAMADVMILPSLYEGLPTVAIEAQAMGLRSLIADTITQECDMGLGLTRFLPIDNGADCWAEAIENLQSMERTPRQTIEQVLSEKGYTDSGAVQRYISVLNRKIAEK